MTTIWVNADDEELNPVRPAGENVSGQGCGTFDGHGLLASKFKQRHLSCKCPGQGLRMTHESGGGEGEVVANLEQLLHAFVGNEMAHGCSVVCTNHYTTFESDANGAGAGLQDALLFGHVIHSTVTLFEP